MLLVDPNECYLLHLHFGERAYRQLAELRVIGGTIFASKVSTHKTVAQQLYQDCQDPVNSEPIFEK